MHKNFIAKGMDALAPGDDTAAYVNSLAAEALGEIYGNVPVVGRPLQSLAGGMGPAKYAGWADAFSRAPGAVVDAFADPDTMSTAKAKAVADALSVGAVLPLRNLVFRPGELLYEWAQGNVQDLRDVPFTPAGKIGVRK